MASAAALENHIVAGAMVSGNDLAAMVFAGAVAAAAYVWTRGRRGQSGGRVIYARKAGKKGGGQLWRAALGGLAEALSGRRGGEGGQEAGRGGGGAIPAPPAAAGDLGAVLDLIGRAEAPRGYDQVYSGIRAADRPPRPLTQMTVYEVLAWQDSIDSRYPSEAAGRYQVMEDTLRRLVNAGRISGRARFDPATQDAVAIELMREAGLARWQAGAMSTADFADRLARVWAGLPVQRDQRGARRYVRRGQSYYASVAGNRATVPPEAVTAALEAARKWA